MKQSEVNDCALQVSDLGPGILGSSYIIHGYVLHRAAELMALKEQGEKLPFDKFYPLHYGNPQLLGQPPITFLRQVIAGTLCPSLLEADVFPDSVIRRVRLYLKAISNGAMGGYSDASGFDVFRKAVSKYISKRDDCECDFNNIYLTDGALDGMIFMNNLIFSKKDAGIMLPVPGFPRYSFLAEQVQGKTVNYSLIEEKNWAIDVFFHLDDRL